VYSDNRDKSLRYGGFFSLLRRHLLPQTTIMDKDYNNRARLSL
jgi:hypothetical protein